MNAAKTCLILGAGASKPYGYPLGDELKEQIIKYCRSRPKNCAEEPNLKFTWGHLEIFAERFEKDGSKTIDQFIQKLKGEHEREPKEHGKMALAAVLGRYEQPLDLINGWYKFLWGYLRHFSAMNPLRIVTFNYDRSLEFLVSRISQGEHSCSQEESRKRLCEAVQIKHYYGQLAALPPLEGPLSVEYGDINRNGWYPWKARESLRFIWDEPDLSTQQTCRTWITEADYVVVLGFGFHEQNMEQLGLNALQAGKCLFSSGYELRIEDRKRVQKKCLPASIHIGTERADVKTFLQQTDVLAWASEGRPPAELLTKLNGAI